ncbi:MAG: hypothetical protein K1W26_17000 [Acetatifactor sp.]
MSKKTKLKLWVCICVAAVIIVLGVLLICKITEPQENIFFLEYESEYEKEDTIIYRYNATNKTVTEVGKVKGELQDCVINSNETCITGVIYEEVAEIVRYNLLTGEVETLDAARKIDTLTDNRAGWGNILIYDGGNKIFVGFEDDIGNEKWLLYNMETDQYEVVESKDVVSNYLTVYDNKLWYITHKGILYRYDLSSKEKIKIMEHLPTDAVVMPDAGLVAFTKDTQIEKIYLYNILTQKTLCMIEGGWNTYFGQLSWTNSRWSDNGNEFFYVKSFPGLFHEATIQMMTYDVITHRSRCIYKVKMTNHLFRYVMKR